MTSRRYRQTNSAQGFGLGIGLGLGVLLDLGVLLGLGLEIGWLWSELHESCSREEEIANPMEISAAGGGEGSGWHREPSGGMQ